MYAVDDLSDAIDVTREFLTPIRAGTWLKLALIVLFISGAGFNPGFSGGDPGAVSDDPTADTPVETPELTDDLLVLLVVIAVLAFLVWLAWNVLAALMEFVFIESLRAEEVRIRRYGGRNLWRALHLFLFRIALGIAALAAIAVPAGLAFLLAGGLEELTIAVVLSVAFIALVVGFLYVVASRFTTVFVTAVMLTEERGIVSAWRRFWPTMTANWKEYLVYLVLIWIVQFAVGIGVFFLLAIVGIVLALLFGVPALALILLAGDVGVIIGALVAVLGVLTFILLALLIDVPVESYYRYYALLVLGDTDADLDLIADQRARVRGDGGTDDSDAGGYWDRDDRSGAESSEADPWDDVDGWERSSDWDDPDGRDDESSWDDRDGGSRWDDDRDDTR
ncbi:DUF7544 domain-containing protein [Natrononativus amylolyticus]|uniref:DUF7544 domain-containing protein n=1 Tax=Natrononativus amylolyticus TaxID=2963434 RepID=UPI0020CDB4D4|nr:hypothetical protein [Natrononativus amylolyticus]